MPVKNNADKSLFLVYFKRIPLWLYPLLVTGFLFMPVEYVYFNGDGVEYMGHALNNYNGYGLLDIDRTTPLTSRVFFPIYMAQIFNLFGPSEFVVFFFIRIFYVFNTLLVYFFAKNLFEQKIGLIASLLVLTSFSLNEWQTIINLDYMLAFFMLASMYSLHQGFEKKQIYWFILAGLAMSLGFLLKETAVVLLALPGLLWLFIYRTRKNFLGAMAVLMTVALVVGSWLGYINFIVNQSDVGVGTQGGSVVENSVVQVGNSSLLQMTGQIFGAFFTYYHTHLSPNFFLAPLLVVAWGFIFFSMTAGQDKQASRVLTICLIPFLPQIVFQGMFGFRASQGIIIFFLSYIALAQFPGVASTFFARKLHSAPKNGWLPHLQTMAPVILVAGVIMAQALESQVEFEGRPVIQIKRVGRGSMIDHISRFNTIQYLSQRDKRWVTGLEWGQDVAAWMDKHIPAGTALMTTAPVERTLFWSTRGDYFFHHYPWINSSFAAFAANPTISPHEKILFLQSKKQQLLVETDITLNRLQALTENRLLDEIRAKDIQYVIVGDHERFQLAYFMQSPGFVLRADFGQVQIFQVIPGRLTPTNFETHFVDETVKDLKRFANLYPAHYKQLEINFLQNHSDLSILDQIESAKTSFPSIESNYFLHTYFSELFAQNDSYLKTLLVFEEQKLESSPDNSWSFIIKGKIYEALDDYDSAIEAYHQAVSISPTEPKFYLFLGEAYLTRGQSTRNSLDLRQASNIFHQALGLAPEDTTVLDSFVNTLLVLGDLHLDQGLMSKTIAVYEKAIDLDPHHLIAYWQLAKLYEDMGQIDQAFAVYRSAADHRPDAAESYFHLGRLYEIREESKNAMNSYQKAIALKPDLAVSYTRLADLYQTQTMTDTAITLYQKAAANNPQAAWPHVELGKIYLKQVALE